MVPLISLMLEDSVIFVVKPKESSIILEVFLVVVLVGVIVNVFNDF